MNQLQGIGVLVILASFSSIAYRLGGAKGYNTKWRDWGCPILLTTYMLCVGYRTQAILIIPYVLSFLLLWGALATYWDKIFGYDNMFCHGLGIGLSLLPFAWFGVSWLSILLRTLVLSFAFGWLNIYPAKWGWKRADLIEELSRGALIIVTLIILK